MKRIYLDNSATTAMDPKVIEAMGKAFLVFGNPSSLHSFGQEARSVVDQSRESVADFLDCQPTEIIFTSGGSESNNLAIRGIVDSRQITDNSKPHIITSAIEHHAVLHTVQDLEKEGKIEATYIKPGKNGIIAVTDVEAAIKPNTILISVMYVNNEVGMVQPIRDVGKMVERLNLLRAKQKGRHSHEGRGCPGGCGNLLIVDPRAPLSSRTAGPEHPQGHLRDDKLGKLYFHTDAVQAAEFFPMGTKYLHVDLLTMTAHKIHGPKGVGVLFVKKGTPIASQITGGDHEFGLRAGTENTASIAGLAAAIEEIRNQKFEIRNKSEIINTKNQNATDCHSEVSTEESQRSFASHTQDDNWNRIKRLRDKLEDFILKNIPDTHLNGDKELRAPHVTNISFKNAEGEAIILNLDFLGIAVSSGSACTARSLESSHVLTAMELPHELSHGAIRFSLSKYTTEEEIDKVLEVLPKIIKKLREMSPFK